MGGHAVVGRGDDDHRSIDHGARPPGDAGEPDRELLEPAQAPRWLRERVEPAPGRRHGRDVERQDPLELLVERALPSRGGAHDCCGPFIRSACPATTKSTTSARSPIRWCASPTRSRNARAPACIGTSPSPISSLTTMTRPGPRRDRYERVGQRAVKDRVRVGRLVAGQEAEPERQAFDQHRLHRIRRCDGAGQIRADLDGRPFGGSLAPVSLDPAIELRVAGSRGCEEPRPASRGEPSREREAVGTLAAACPAENEREQLAHRPTSAAATRAAANASSVDAPRPSPSSWPRARTTIAPARPRGPPRPPRRLARYRRSRARRRRLRQPPARRQAPPWRGRPGGRTRRRNPRPPHGRRRAGRSERAQLVTRRKRRWHRARRSPASTAPRAPSGRPPRARSRTRVRAPLPCPAAGPAGPAQQRSGPEP